jgi:predicted GIY-YIG superfamily endonuclease
VPFIYMLRCRDGSLYTGIAKDLAQRLERHHLGKASAARGHAGPPSSFKRGQT